MEHNRSYEQPGSSVGISHAVDPYKWTVFNKNDQRFSWDISAIHISGNARVHIGDQILYSSGNELPSHPQDLPWDQKNYDQLVSSLRFDRMYARVQNISPAMPHTGDWLVRHTKYHAWIDEGLIADHHGFLWLKGKPGTGKSTLMKLVYDHAARHQSKGVILSYFFNARAPNDLEKSSLGMYRSMLLQLLDGLPATRFIFCRTFYQKAKHNMCFWTISEIQQFLQEVMKTPMQAHVTILVDALDEGKEDDIRQMISFLEDLTDLNMECDSGNVLRICLSSRHYPHISIRHGISIILEDQVMHAHDIRRYIDRRLIIPDPNTMQALNSRIRQKSGGIFLWVVLVVPMMNTMYDNGCTLTDMLSHIETVPTALHGVFGNVLFGNRKDIQDTVRLFQWLLFAARPLDIEELYAVTNSEYWKASRNDWNQPVQVMQRYLLNRSRGLIEFVSHTPSCTTVQFIHETVRDFLLHKSGLADLDESLTDCAVGLSHERIMRFCFYEFRRGRSGALRHGVCRSKHLLLLYALDYMFWHAALAQGSGVSQQNFLGHLYSHSRLISDWLRLHYLLSHDLKLCLWSSHGSSQFAGSYEPYDMSLSLLYVLIAMFNTNADCLVEALLTTLDNVSIVGGYFGNPLQAACALGKENIARLLIEKGADIHVSGGHFENVLVAALHRSSDSFVELVLHCQAGTSKATLADTLRTMVVWRHIWRIHKVIEMGAELDGMLPGNYEPATSLPLHYAIRTGDVSVLQALIEDGANINNVTEGILSPLTYAVQTGTASMVLCLLRNGANPNINHTSGYGSPLHTAIDRGEDYSLILIKHGSHGDVIGQYLGRTCTALEMAMLRNKFDIVNRLLESGASFDTIQHEFYGNIFHTMAVKGNVEGVRIMLERGADIDRISGQYGTALQAAACGGELEVVKVLLEYGADVDVEAGEYGNAMSGALDGGNEKIIKLLEEKGAVPANIDDASSCESEPKQHPDP